MKIKEMRERDKTLRAEQEALRGLQVKNREVVYKGITIKVYDNGILVKCNTTVSPKPLSEHSLVLSDQEAINLAYILGEVY